MSRKHNHLRTGVKHEISRRVKKAAELRIRSSRPIHAPIQSDLSGHKAKPRNGQPQPVVVPKYRGVVSSKAHEHPPVGKGYNTIRRKSNMLDLRDYEQPVTCPETGKLTRAKFEPIINALGNKPPVISEIEANVMANETVPYAQWAREFIWSQED